MHEPTQQLRQRFGADVRRVDLRSTYEVCVQSGEPSDAELIAICGGREGRVQRARSPSGAPLYLVTVTR